VPTTTCHIQCSVSQFWWVCLQRGLRSFVGRIDWWLVFSQRQPSNKCLTHKKLHVASQTGEGKGELTASTATLAFDSWGFQAALSPRSPGGGEGFCFCFRLLRSPLFLTGVPRIRRLARRALAKDISVVARWNKPTVRGKKLRKNFVASPNSPAALGCVILQSGQRGGTLSGISGNHSW
jgi:hypothetical protein